MSESCWTTARVKMPCCGYKYQAVFSTIRNSQFQCANCGRWAYPIFLGNRFAFWGTIVFSVVAAGASIVTKEMVFAYMALGSVLMLVLKNKTRMI